MLIKDARVENNNGIRFFEKDILKDDYVFSEDVEVSVTIDYILPGFGVVLMDSGGDSSSEKSNAYLFKIGYKQASVHHAGSGFQNLEKQISSHKIKTITEGMKITLRKVGKIATLFVNGEKVIDYLIKNELPRYNIGYYSNQGNVIKDIKIRSATPNRWNINMENTTGGYVRFLDDTIVLDECVHDAEIEQQNILLESGEHYISYEIDKNYKDSDIKVYVHKSTDDRLYDEEKNILKDGKIRLIEDTEINIKIVGRRGIIKNISISKIPNDDYISTTDNKIDFSGSYLDAYISGLSKITWRGNVNKVPNFFLDNKIAEYGVVMDNKNAVKPEECGISFGYGEPHLYSYEFNCETYLFKIHRYGKIIYTKTLKDIVNKITIFKNISATITELILYKINGEIVNVNIQNENKQFVNADINSPIIVTDKYNYPLDLSASYRKSISNDKSRFIFTNWEREIFEVNRMIKLDKTVSKESDSVIIYGIRNGFAFDINKIYDIKEDNINSIDLMTRNYDRLSKDVILHYNQATKEMILDKKLEEKYSHIIIDYKKMNSYCINYHYNRHSYEIDVSSDEDKFKILYNSKELDGKDNVYQINEYKNTNISGNTTGYIVLRKGV